MANYIPLGVKKSAKVEEISLETKYWKSFVSPVLVKENNSITDISFNPTNPNELSVTASTRVQIYSTKTNSVTKSISRFSDTAYSGSFRSDGKLVVAGDNGGLIQVFDTKSRAVLRTMNEHRGPVRMVKFHQDNTKLLSGSDDKLVKVWDVPSQTSISTFTDHSDYVRSGCVNPANPNVYISGSYDSTVKLFDARNPTSKACILTLNHDAPVEDVLIYPTGSLLAVAGGPYVKIYDIITGRCLHTLDNFQKTVTCLSLDGEKSRLLAGSLDHHVKIYDLSTYSMAHSVKYPSPVLSLGISNNNSTLAVGMVSGALSLRSRRNDKKLILKREFNDLMEEKDYKSSRQAKLENRLEHFLPPIKQKNHDRLMREFKYREALNSLMEDPQLNRDMIMEMFKELLRRGSLEQALSGHDDQSLCPILLFLAKNFIKTTYFNIILEVSTMVIDMYGNEIIHAPVLASAMFSLKTRVQHEFYVQRDLLAITGMADMVKTKATTN